MGADPLHPFRTQPAVTCDCVCSMTVPIEATETTSTSSATESQQAIAENSPSEVVAPELMAPADSGEARPSERIQIGSQREGDDAAPLKAKPTNPVTVVKEEPKRGNFPPPNVRDALTPELEAELAAALGGESLDAIIEGSSAPPPRVRNCPLILASPAR